jgi:hypothetical protein
MNLQKLCGCTESLVILKTGLGMVGEFFKFVVQLETAVKVG